MTTPSVRAVGAVTSGISTITPTMPTHEAGDILLLFLESCGGEAASLTTPQGFVQIAQASPQATGATTAGTRITIFWKRAVNNASSSPLVADPGNHVVGHIISVKDCAEIGDPLHIAAGAVKATASTSATAPAVTTTKDSCLILHAIARDNLSSSADFSSAANANLGSLTQQVNDGTLSGNGGGLGIWSGTLNTAGNSGSLSATVVSSINASITLALLPAHGSKNFSEKANGASTDLKFKAPDVGNSWSEVWNDTGSDTLISNGSGEAAASGAAGGGFIYSANINAGGTANNTPDTYSQLMITTTPLDLKPLFLVHRYVDISNYYILGIFATFIRFYKCVGGTTSTIGSDVSYTCAIGDVVETVVSGNRLMLSINGVVKKTEIDTDVTGAGRNGIAAGDVRNGIDNTFSAGQWRWDNYFVIYLTQTTITKSLQYAVKTTPTAITKSLQYVCVPPVTSHSITKSLKYCTKVTAAAITKSLKYCIKTTVVPGATQHTSQTLPGTGQQVDNNDVFISNATNIKDIQGGNVATGLIETATYGVFAILDSLNATNFGFNIPTTATITGVEVRVNRRSSLDSDNGTVAKYVVDSSVKLLKAGTPTGNNNGDTVTHWPTTLGTKVYGSSSDLWGNTLTPSDINASNFGVEFIGKGQSTGFFYTNAEIDYITIEVYYTLPGIQKTLTYAIKAPVAITKSLKYTNKTTPAAKTKSLQYCIKTTHAAITKSLQYAIRKSNPITKSLKYCIKSPVAITKSLKYCVKTTHAAITKSLQYAIRRTPTAITKSLKYCIKAPVAITKSLKYTTKVTPAALTKSLKYCIKTTHTAITKSLQYAVRKGIPITKSLQYAIKAPVAITKSLKYTVKTAHAAITKSLKYCIKTTPTALTKSLKYTTRVTPAAITKSLKYCIRTVPAAATKSLRYAIVKSTAITKSLQYLVVGSAIPHSITKSLQYTIRKSNAVTKSLKYCVKTTHAALTKSLQYTVRRTPAAITKSLKYCVKAPVAITKSLKYTIKTTHAAITKSLQYSIKKSNAITKSLKYCVKTTPTAVSKSLKYTIVIPHAITKTLLYKIKAPVAITKSLKYCIKAPHAAITKSLKYTVFKTQTAITKSLRYAIRKTPALTKSLTYNIFNPLTTHSITKSLKYCIVLHKAAIQKTLVYVIRTTDGYENKYYSRNNNPYTDIYASRGDVYTNLYNDEPTVYTDKY